MAFDWVYEDLRGERRPAIVGPDLAPVTPVQVLGRPGVTVTGSGNYKGQEGTITKPAVDGLAAVEIKFGNSRGGESLQDTEATVAFTGTIAGPVVGATSSTAQGTLVYLTSSKTLTLTAGSNTKFGVVQFFRGEKSATDTAVTFGVNLG